ncbi:MAG: penicillin-binding protein 2, partial [Alphaproteobacteria bacterium]|nr:penicillin-binding protein 2 [Alphaproteobacteria bacterium]
DKLGFGRLTGIELRGEKKGLLPSRAWKEAVKGDGWRMGDTLNLSIGQGFLNATPIQLAQMITSVANGQYNIPLTLIKDNSQLSAELKSLNIPKSHLNVVYKGMNAVVNEQEGTAYGSRFTYKGQKMAGKTASTQVRRISLKERQEGIKSQDELPWKYRDHAMFVAFTPVDKPRYAVAVVVEHGGGGSKTAAPIASKMLQEVLRLEYEDAQKKKEIKQ